MTDFPIRNLRRSPKKSGPTLSVVYLRLVPAIPEAHSGWPIFSHTCISVGPDCVTHQALEDIAVMRVLPHMIVLSPCDAKQTRAATMAAIEQVNGPVYLRFGRAIDEEAIIKAAKETAYIITAEEHQITGGLGSAVAEVVLRVQPLPIRMTGMPDRFGESGEPGELMDKYGMRAVDIVEAAVQMRVGSRR